VRRDYAVDEKALSFEFGTHVFNVFFERKFGVEGDSKVFVRVGEGNGFSREVEGREWGAVFAGEAEDYHVGFL
jgi:hypothetical protein